MSSVTPGIMYNKWHNILFQNILHHSQTILDPQDGEYVCPPSLLTLFGLQYYFFSNFKDNTRHTHTFWVCCSLPSVLPLAVFLYMHAAQSGYFWVSFELWPTSWAPPLSSFPAAPTNSKTSISVGSEWMRGWQAHFVKLHHLTMLGYKKMMLGCMCQILLKFPLEITVWHFRKYTELLSCWEQDGGGGKGEALWNDFF